MTSRGLCSERIGPCEVKDIIATLFDKIANEKERYTATHGQANKQPPSESEFESNSLPDDVSDQGDSGLFDLEDSLNAEADGLSNSLVDWGKQFTDLNETVQTVSSKLNEISQFGQPDRTEMRSQINLVTEKLLLFSNFGNNKIGAIEDHLEAIFQSMSGIMDVIGDFDEGNVKREEARQQISNLSSTVMSAELGMTKYIEVMEGLPRIDKDFNRARDSVVIVHKRLRKKMRDFSSRLEQISKLSD